MICHSGVFIAKSEYYSLERLESAKLRQGILGMMFGFGSIQIIMYQSNYREIININNINAPRQHIKALQKTLKAHS